MTVNYCHCPFSQNKYHISYYSNCSGIKQLAYIVAMAVEKKVFQNREITSKITFQFLSEQAHE